MKVNVNMNMEVDINMIMIQGRGQAYEHEHVSFVNIKISRFVNLQYCLCKSRNIIALEICRPKKNLRVATSANLLQYL
jgi:hypothetical protein